MYNNTTIYKDNDIYFLELYYIHFHSSDNIAFSEENAKCLVNWRAEDGKWGEKKCASASI